MVNLWLIMVNTWNNNISGWWFQTWLLVSISYMGCHPKPIDELIFFKMLETTNQIVLSVC